MQGIKIMSTPEKYTVYLFLQEPYYFVFNIDSILGGIMLYVLE